MTLEQLEQRVNALELEVARLRRQWKPLQPLPSVPQTFAMFADDPEFEEVIRWGREFRQQANAEKP